MDRGEFRGGAALLRGCLVAAGCFTLLHVLALPLAVPYDGHEYIDFAGVLFSDRFPRDWQPPIRTPGYPLALKAAFGLLGRQPLAVVAVNAALAFTMLVAVARGTRSLAGPTAAAAAVILVAVFPLSVAYQHHALTESGAAAWLTLVAAALLLPDDSARKGWWKAAAVAAALTAGYYHRQSLQFVAPVAAGLLALGGCCRPGTPWLAGLRRPPRSGWIVALQAAVVLCVPAAAAGLWEPFAPSGNIRSYMLKQGIVRQALVPPDDPLLGDTRAPYAAAVNEGWRGDWLVSGLRAARIGDLSVPLYPRLDPPARVFRRLALAQPGRYAAGLGRTLLLFAGFPAAQSTNRSAEHVVFGPSLATGCNRIDDGRPNLTEATRAAFSQPAAPGLLSAVLWRLAPGFDHGLVPVGFLALVALGVAGAWGRDVRLLVVAAVPLTYLLGHAAMLASEDRYAFPAQPIALAAAAAVLVRGLGNMRSRFLR